MTDTYLLLGQPAWLLLGDLNDLAGGRGHQSLAATQDSTESLTFTQGSSNPQSPDTEGLRGFATQKGKNLGKLAYLVEKEWISEPSSAHSLGRALVAGES